MVEIMIFCWFNYTDYAVAPSSVNILGSHLVIPRGASPFLACKPLTIYPLLSDISPPMSSVKLNNTPLIRLVIRMGKSKTSSFSSRPARKFDDDRIFSVNMKNSNKSSRHLFNLPDLFECFSCFSSFPRKSIVEV